jgi:hypothetical protein
MGKTISVRSSHFSIWSMVKALQIHPKSKTVRVSRTLDLQVVFCYEPDSFDSRGYECSAAFAPTTVFVHGGGVSEWSVNGKLGGGHIFGGVIGFGGGDALYISRRASPFQALSP